MKSSSHPGMEKKVLQVVQAEQGLLLVCHTAIFSVVTQRSPPLVIQWGGALHDNTKNGCVADQVCYQIINFGGSFDQELKINNNNKTVPSHPHNHVVASWVVEVVEVG